MKRLFLISVVIIGLTFSFCKPDETETTTEENPKAKFISKWQCTEVSKRDGAAQPYEVHITDSAGNFVKLENFYAMGFNIKPKAEVSGSNITLINNQSLSGIVVKSGSGYFENSTTLKWNYIIDDGNPHTDTCTATFVKI
jgi:hypothetical protein